MTADTRTPAQQDHDWIRARADKIAADQPSLAYEDALAQACQERADYRERQTRGARRVHQHKPLTVTLADLVKASRKGSE